MSFKLSDIQSDARYFALGSGTDTQYADVDLNRNINRWYETVLSWILTANGDWQVNGEVSVTNIVAGQREYILPGDILKLNEVYIKINGVYIKATQIDSSLVFNEPDTNYYPANPEFDLKDNSIFIYTSEASISAVTDGIKIHYQTDIIELSGATDAPNLSEPFKRLLSTGAACDYCLAKEAYNKAKKLENRIYGDPTVKSDKGIKNDMLEYYANRSLTKPNILKTAKRNFR